jgi:predicted ATPase/DNA-binding SARP family transcriptional activator
MADPARRGDLSITLLGGFQVVVDGRAIAAAEWRLRKPKSLVKLLALAPDYTLHREQVLDLLWPELEPEAAAANLRHSLHVARRTLDPKGTYSPPLILGDGDRLALRRTGSIDVDVVAFEAAVNRARRTRDPTDYDAAVALYRGDLLPEDRYDDWAAGRRQTLREACLGALLELARLREARDDRPGAIEALRRAVDLEPSHEEAHVGLMRLYALNRQRHLALQQHQKLRDALRRELDALPDQATERLAADIRSGRFPIGETKAITTTASASTTPSNLPIPLTGFVGRADAIAELRNVLGAQHHQPRLLTLTGAGGSGKTRLAIAVARELLPTFPGGVWLVELASLADPALVPDAVAAAIGLRNEGGQDLPLALAAFLRDKSALVVLDNCEHLLPGCAGLARSLLQNCAQLRILATSREPLGVEGERNWRVPSLGLPDLDALLRGPANLVTALQMVETIQLFCERAVDVQPAFVLSPDNALAVANVCRRLDGMPLAIELAAARVKVLGVEQIAARLDDRFRLLTGGNRTTLPRHQTLRATMEWSDALLSEPERRLLRRLAVFAGGWTLDAAEAVCSEMLGVEYGALGDGNGPPAVSPPSTHLDVLDLLTRLVDKSLVQVDLSESEPRYRLLETVRQFALEGLAAAGELNQTRRRHAAYFLSFVEPTYAQLRGSRQLAWLRRLDRELVNLRSAMSMGLEQGDADLTLGIGGGLDRFWQYHPHLVEGRRWLEQGLALTSRASDSIRARALGLLGWVVRFIEGAGPSRPILEEALSLYETLGDERGIADVTDSLGDVAYFSDDPIRAREIHEANLLRRRNLRDRWGVAMSLNSLGWTWLATGQTEPARALFDESLAIVRELGEQRSIAMLLHSLALVALEKHDDRAVKALAVESLLLNRARGDHVGIAQAIGLLATIVVPEQPARATRLFGAAQGLLQTAGARTTTGIHFHHRPIIAALRDTLGPPAFAEAWAAGARQSLTAIVADALAVANDPLPSS